MTTDNATPSVLDVQIDALKGGPANLAQYAGQAVLVVNVASKCGLTPQYTGLEALQQRYGGDDFTVLGAPCNQFGGQEPGTAEEIQTFCSTTYGTSFPMTEKLDVNGEGRHPLYDQLTATPDGDGEAGDVQWNFEKFLIGKDGAILARFRPRTEPEAGEITAAIEQALA